MANPFLVLGGVAVGVVTAGIGIMQVPGWIDSANDSAARSDLSQIAIGQEAAYTVAANYTTLDNLKEGTTEDNSGDPVSTGVEIQTSAGVINDVAVNDVADEWAAVSVSSSGHVFVRTSESAEVLTADTKDYDEAIAEIAAPGLTLGGTADAPTVEFTAVP